MRKYVLLTIALLTLPVSAHTVLWWENQDGSNPASPMVFSSLDEDSLDDYIEIVPSTGEPCTVVVNLDPVTSPYISARTLLPNPANWVEVEVSLAQLPPFSTNPILTTVTGEWHATGVPVGFGCDATNANRFSVPVKIALSPKKWTLTPINTDSLWLWTGSSSPTGLRAADSLWGPWINVGVNTSFMIMPTLGAQFYKSNHRLGGALGGVILDNNGNSQSNITVSLPYGGPFTITPRLGNFQLGSLPWGTNLIGLSKSLTFVDSGTGSNRTETAGVEVLAPATNSYVNVQLKVEIQIFPPPPACNCSPWCAIGFGTLDGAQTPVYFSGGANPPKGVPPSCGQPQVTVTPPNGPPFDIKPGTGRHQNSGPSPAAGTWTVTTTVCGQSKSCTLTVP